MILGPVIADAVPGFFAPSILLGLLAHPLFFSRFFVIGEYYLLVFLRLDCLLVCLIGGLVRYIWIYGAGFIPGLNRQ